MQLFAPSPLAESRLLPQRTVRLTPWLIAVLMFVTVVVGAAGFAIANAAQAVARGAEQRWSIQLAGGAAQAPAVAAAMRAMPGVAAVRPVPETEVRGLLEQWLGPAAQARDLPLPGLIDLELAPGADPEPLRRRLLAAAPTARLTSFSDQLGPILANLKALQWLALAIVLMMAAATAAAVVLATRGAYDTHRQTIEVLHGVGATDEQLAGLFQRRMAREALVGGAGGAIGGLLVILAVLVGSGPMFPGAGQPLRPLDLILLGLLPLAAALLALAVARVTIITALRANL